MLTTPAVSSPIPPPSTPLTNTLSNAAYSVPRARRPGPLSDRNSTDRIVSVSARMSSPPDASRNARWRRVTAPVASIVPTDRFGVVMVGRAPDVSPRNTSGLVASSGSV